MKTQMQMFWEEHRKIADGNLAFLELSKDMTREELARCIERRPLLWGRFSNWLTILPSGGSHV